MAKANKWKRSNNRGSPRFFSLRHDLLQCGDYMELDKGPRMVLDHMFLHYNGRNNGNLSATFSDMKKRGMGSPATLSKAIKTLLARNLIVQTRAGQFINPGGRCALYAFTWLPIDECPGKHLEVAPTKSPARKLSLQ